MHPSATAVAAGPYGLQRPTPADAQQAVKDIFGAEADAVWQRITRHAGLGAASSAGASSAGASSAGASSAGASSAATAEYGADEHAVLSRLVEVMRQDADPVVALCAQSLQIRLDTYTHLTAAHATIRGAG